MIHFLKLVGSLLLDQAVCLIAAAMMPLCVATFFNNSLFGYLLVAAVTISLFVYTAYRSGFKSGFHDPHRLTKDRSYKGYLCKGLLAGAVSAIPLLIVYLIYLYTRSGNAALCFWMLNMYWTWPLLGAFPNHQQAIMLLAFVPMVAVPWIGYIAGYKNFVISDLLMKFYKKIAERLPEE